MAYSPVSALGLGQLSQGQASPPSLSGMGAGGASSNWQAPTQVLIPNPNPTQHSPQPSMGASPPPSGLGAAPYSGAPGAAQPPVHHPAPQPVLQPPAPPPPRMQLVWQGGSPHWMQMATQADLGAPGQQLVWNAGANGGSGASWMQKGTPADVTPAAGSREQLIWNAGANGGSGSSWINRATPADIGRSSF